METAAGAAIYWLTITAGTAFAISATVLLPLGMFRATRHFAGTGLVVASFVLGLTLWAYSALLTFTLWGWIALVVGLVLLGVGVVPMAFLALAVHTLWVPLVGLGLLLVATFVVRALGFHCLSERWSG